MEPRTRNLLIGAAVIGAAAYFFLRPKAAVAAPVMAPVEPPPPPPEPDKAPVTTPTKVETKGPTAPIPAGSTYTLKKGESLANIAERVFGNYRWWPFIWDRNSKQFASPDLIQPGQSIVVPSKAELPVGKQAKYFARAQEHAKIWSKWTGKGVPTLPATVLYPDGKAPAVEASVPATPKQEAAVTMPRMPGIRWGRGKEEGALPPPKTTEQMLEEQAAAMKAAGAPTGGRAGLDTRAAQAEAEMQALMGFRGLGALRYLR